MSTQTGARPDGDVAAELAVMGDVNIAHDVVVVAQFRHRFRLRAARDGDEFTNRVALADAQIAGLLFAEFLIKRIDAELRAGEQVITLTERSVALNDHERLQPVVGANLYSVFDDAVIADDGAGIDASTGMNHSAWHRTILSQPLREVAEFVEIAEDPSDAGQNPAADPLARQGRHEVDRFAVPECRSDLRLRARTFAGVLVPITDQAIGALLDQVKI